MVFTSLRPHDGSFKAKRALGFFVVSVLYSLVFFHRVNPSIVADDMSADYNVSKASLSIFSSMYFYPYAVIQPFAGLLSDVMEPAYLIGVAHIVTSIGSSLCGYSDSFFGGCIGRFLVGLGCGPTYVPISRFFANWFSLEYYSILTGVILAVGGLGGVIAQVFLPKINKIIGWRNSFYLFGGVDLLFSFLCLLLVNGNPVTIGYNPVNEDLNEDVSKMPISEKLDSLSKNFFSVIKLFHFWVVVVVVVLVAGPFFNAAGMWLGPYLKDVHNYGDEKAGSCQMYTSIGMILGSLILPYFSNKIKTRKYVMIGNSIIGLTSSLIMFKFGKDLSTSLMKIVLTVFGFSTNPIASVAYPLIREYYHPSVAATAVGCINFFTFLSSAFYQTITGYILKSYGTIPGTKKYIENGYKYGLWMLSSISIFMSIIVNFIVKDSDTLNKEYQSLEPEKEEFEDNEFK